MPALKTPPARPQRIPQTEPASPAPASTGLTDTQLRATAVPVSVPGVATSAKQAAPGTAGSPSADVLSVQGVKSGTALPVSFPATSKAEISQAEQLRQLVAIGQATLYVLTQVLAVTQGRIAPLRGEEAESLICEFLDGRNISIIAN
jgi:hypothetical protein